MTKPQCPAMEELEAIAEDIAQMEDGISELKERLKVMPAQIACQLQSHAERLDAARYLYWTQSELPVASIAEGLLGTNVHKLTSLIGLSAAELQCDRCSQTIKFTSRTNLQEAMRARRTAARTGRSRYAEGYVVICEDCWASLQQERKAQYEAHDERVRARQHVLRTMPYRDYLQSPEWQSRRARHLKSSGYRCQVCNAANTQLDVHHRTYERRGNEFFKDLIALCRECHGLFHREGRLASE